MKVRKTSIFLFLILLSVICAFSWFISYTKFDVHNPFSVLNGLFTVFYTDNDYAVIGSDPQVIIAKTDFSLDNYMFSRGFIKDEDSQLGSLHVYQKGDDRECIMFSVNGYYAKCCWLE